MERRLAEVGAALRRMGATMKLSYGTGGYCVILTLVNGKQYVGYSWDIDEAFLIAEARQAADSEECWDEDTQIDHRKPK
jgi:hypothetical protein